MNNGTGGLQSAVNLFSKVQEVSFEFLAGDAKEDPFIILFFSGQERKQLAEVLSLFKNELRREKLKLTVSENEGDFLSLSFFLDNPRLIFSCSPDRYNRRQLRDFKNYTLYGDAIKLFFSIIHDKGEEIVNGFDDGKTVSFLDTIFHNYIP